MQRAVVRRPRKQACHSIAISSSIIGAVHTISSTFLREHLFLNQERITVERQCFRSRRAQRFSSVP
jgi:hypothetical protein